MGLVSLRFIHSKSRMEAFGCFGYNAFATAFPLDLWLLLCDDSQRTYASLYIISIANCLLFLTGLSATPSSNSVDSWERNDDT
eukprot:scaffold432884_cov19-Prasinocladus_malaysianus.AAC.1